MSWILALEVFFECICHITRQEIAVLVCGKVAVQDLYDICVDGMELLRVVDVSSYKGDMVPSEEQNSIILNQEAIHVGITLIEGRLNLGVCKFGLVCLRV